MKPITKIEKICEQELIDSVTGPMMPSAISEELQRVFDNRTPEDIVVVMKRKDLGTDRPIYQTSIYMSKEDFKKYKPCGGVVYPIKEE